MNAGADNADSVELGELRYRYAVVEVDGDVPDQIRKMVDDPEAFLLYKENRGPESQQDYLVRGRPSGGWYMERRGAVRVCDGKIIEEIPEDRVADLEPAELN